MQLKSPADRRQRETPISTSHCSKCRRPSTHPNEVGMICGESLPGDYHCLGMMEGEKRLEVYFKWPIRTDKEITMKCPRCQSGTRVIDTEETHNHTRVRRRRRCKVCHHRFTTSETISSPRSERLTQLPLPLDVE